ncbi:TatD family hydrolase [Phreatobacter cathodiphilus]|uniref:LuxR family transcriptional regulator n=1 Tax=Phreatobacter cathodiphilus TaxID=1868589 RepID=A0A2S0N9W2_9HYPH|nr:TatD family hydrolase [Phreatobacter cathodiphilus]AVO44932.1 LuxR family transcriptional regulator [Phreatobacter cathodiphilus]
MWVDSHCHLDFPELAADRDGLIGRAVAAGLRSMVTISTRVRRFDGIRAIAEAHDGIWCSVGTHPHNAHEELDVTAEELVALAEHPRVIAIGEAGLDFFYDKSPREAQEQGFRTHIAAARASGLPLVIHAREADATVTAILTEEMGKGAFKAVLHCFTGSRELAMAGVALGLYVSFSGIATYKSAANLRELAAELPADRILVETDAPYLAPGKFRGKTNEPSYVVETGRVIAEARGVAPEEMARQTTENFYRLFAKADPGRQLSA